MATGFAVEAGSELEDREHGLHFRLARPIGGGSFAEIWFALMHQGDGFEPSVVKIFRRPFVAALGERAALAALKEAAALRSIHRSDPHNDAVVRLLASGVVSTEHAATQVAVPWLALEYVRGGADGSTLREKVSNVAKRTGAALGLRSFERLCTDLRRGLGAVHRAGIVHRDVKPANILCRHGEHEEGFVLADFGVSRGIADSATFGGLVVGTPGYAPPEQTSPDARRTGPAADVFAAGCVAYFALTAQELFDAGDSASVRVARRPSLKSAASLHSDFRSRPKAVAALTAAIARATAPRPEDRFRDALELCDALLAAART